jgi:putative acetyltransferase
MPPSSPSASPFPAADDPSRVGTWPAATKSGAGYFWDEILEYRVWCHPERGAPDECDGDDYFYAFATYEEAKAFADATRGAEAPLVLVRQREWVGEPKPGFFEHFTGERLTEWNVEWLATSHREPGSIPAFLAARAH